MKYPQDFAPQAEPSKSLIAFLELVVLAFLEQLFREGLSLRSTERAFEEGDGEGKGASYTQVMRPSAQGSVLGLVVGR